MEKKEKSIKQFEDSDFENITGAEFKWLREKLFVSRKNLAGMLGRGSGARYRTVEKRPRPDALDVLELAGTYTKKLGAGNDIRLWRTNRERFKEVKRK